LTKRLSTGIAGLDEVLLGGLLPGQVYMVRGQPGAGKTTLALQFLIEGARLGEPVLFVTLSESESELRANAASHGRDLAGVDFLDLCLGGEGLSPDNRYTIFHPADVELEPMARRITETMGRLRPVRVAFDSLTEVRLLSRDPLHYRRQLLTLKSYLLSGRVTTLFLGESASQERDVEVASIVQGVVALNLTKGGEGMVRRSVEVEKRRGGAFLEGEHALRIERGGLVVYPRLTAGDRGRPFERSRLGSGIEGLDRMLGGGLDRGTSTLLTGNAGVGKTTLGVAFLAVAARSGDRCAVYTFDEGRAEIEGRSEAVGLEVRDLIDRDLLRIRKVNPLLLYPDEFAAWVRAEVEGRGTRVVMIDSLNGYRQSMPDEGFLVGHMHQLLGYLNQMGVTTLLVNEVPNLTGDFAATQFGLSYLVDTVVVLKYYEHGGALHKAIGVLKKRLGDHEKTLHEFDVTPTGIRVGGPLPQLRGILRGEAEASGPGPGPEVVGGLADG